MTSRVLIPFSSLVWAFNYTVILICVYVFVDCVPYCSVIQEKQVGEGLGITHHHISLSPCPHLKLLFFTLRVLLLMFPCYSMCNPWRQLPETNSSSLAACSRTGTKAEWMWKQKVVRWNRKIQQRHTGKPLQAGFPAFQNCKENRCLRAEVARKVKLLLCLAHNTLIDSGSAL